MTCSESMGNAASFSNQKGVPALLDSTGTEGLRSASSTSPSGVPEHTPGLGQIRLHVGRRAAGLRTVNEARLLLTCGLPGAGKTELAKRLAAVRGAVRLTKDVWLWALGSTPGTSRPGRGSNVELWRLAREILCLGVGVVLDFGLWARNERDEMRSAARCSWRRRRTALPRRGCRRTLATHRGTQHRAALGGPPDPPR